MKKIARFEKVSFQQFLSDWQEKFPMMEENQIHLIYDNIKLPKRATKGSAGYDIYAPISFTLAPNEEIIIPTGLKVYMEQDYVLMVFPRSGLGFKYRLQLNNTVGVIDSDYYYAKNEGHIFCKLTNDTHENKIVEINSGSGMVQGIFMQYGITEDDDVVMERIGGLGSTTEKEK